MVRPSLFGYNEETGDTNFFSNKVSQKGVSDAALAEFDNMVGLLRSNDVEVIVIQDTPESWTPDSIFPNNWFTSHISGELILYPMYAANRRAERKADVLKLLLRKMNHPKLIDLTPWEEKGEFLEGTGSMVFDRDKNIAYACRSKRTSDTVIKDFCSKMGFEAIVFDAFDEDKNPVYHTNVMMSVGMQVAVVCLDAIREQSDRDKISSKLIESGKIIIDISHQQMKSFAGNMLEIKSRSRIPIMVMSESARNSLTADQERIISTYNKIVSVNLNTIETHGGGSARCMIAEIFY